MEARQRLQDARVALDQQQQQTQEDSPVISGDDDENVERNEGVEPQIVSNGSTLDSDGSHQSMKGTTDRRANDFLGAVEDTKPSASSTVRGKRVRIAAIETGIVSSYNEIIPFSQRVVFPAFYRVVHEAGAAVYNDVQMISFVTRVIPVGVVVLGQEMAWRNCYGQNEMMVRIPDGWVSDQQLERIVAVPFESLG
jgi:hypothetical protein